VSGGKCKGYISAMMQFLKRAVIGKMRQYICWGIILNNKDTLA
jgi:hypothetical protein